MEIKVAVSQCPPVLLDLEATTIRAVKIIEDASENGAKLIVFPEAYLPGYPTWIWRLRPGGDMELGNQLYKKLQANAVNIDAGGLERICKAAADMQVVVVMGLNEIDSEYSGSTLFCTVVVIGTDGKILNKHRKLMPTNPERMIWGFGDASGLRVVDTPFGRIGSLICWENYMPLARFALYSQGIDIYIAPTWDSGDSWLTTMKHISKEGGCWVISTATAIQGSDIPKSFPHRERLFEEDEWINAGNAVVIKPQGEVIAGPLRNINDILYATIDPDESIHSRKSLDISGHYGRPDIFKLEIDRRKQPPAHFVNE